MSENEFDKKEFEKTEEENQDTSIVIENEMEEISPEEVGPTLTESVELEPLIQPQNLDSSVEETEDASSSSNGPEEENEGDGSCNG